MIWGIDGSQVSVADRGIGLCVPVLTCRLPMVSPAEKRPAAEWFTQAKTSPDPQLGEIIVDYWPHPRRGPSRLTESGSLLPFGKMNKHLWGSLSGPMRLFTGFAQKPGLDSVP